MRHTFWTWLMVLGLAWGQVAWGQFSDVPAGHWAQADDFAHPVTAVHYVPVSGPNGARASRLVVHYAPLPPRSYVIQDTFAPW